MKISAFIICIILLFSCTGKQERYTNLRPLTLGYADSIPHGINLEKELYDSLGLTLNLTCYATSIGRDSALYNGTIDGTMMDYTDVITLQSKGFPVRIVANVDSAYLLLAGIGNDIRTVDQLRGRNIAVERNTVIEYITDRILQQAGIMPHEVNKVDIRKTSLRLDLLQNGLVDATVLPQPLASKALEDGNHSILSTAELGIPAKAIIFTDVALREKRKEIEAYLSHTVSPTLPPQSELKHIINWLKEKNLISGSYVDKSPADTIKGVKLK